VPYNRASPNVDRLLDDSAPALLVSDLRKSYGGRTVVDGLTFAVERGTCVGLLGPNGAGKTTTLRLLLGHTRPDAGLIEVLGLPIPRSASRARAQLGVVGQNDNLDPDFDVYENLYHYARYYGLDPRRRRERFEELLAFAGLEDRGRTPIRELSGGMKRRLALVRALVHDPVMLFLDEPTTGLDPQARFHLWQRFRQLRREGRTLFLTTHYMEEAERLCDRLLVLDHGRLVAEGSPEALVRTHVEPHVLELPSEAVERLGLGANPPGLRTLRLDEAAFVYARAREDLEALLARCPEVPARLRPANLEDVFFALTGHALRD
jgi:lipooligosaccharide transport system ATP-binding protein